AGEFAVPSGVVTLTRPVVAPPGTVVTSRVSEETANPLVTPLNATVVVPVKPTPVTTAESPTAPLAGATVEISGGTGPRHWAISTETVLLLVFATTASMPPSWSRSAALMPTAPMPTP